MSSEQPENRVNVKPSTRQILKKQWKFIVIIVAIGAMLFWIAGYREITGLFPIPGLNKPEYIVPSGIDYKNQTYQQVMDFIESDDTNKIPYREGFNCVDATFRVWRNASWNKLAAVPIIIQFYEPPGHMVIYFPTKDYGDVIIEPQSDMRIRPRIGEKYNDKKVRGLYLFDFTPIPVDNSPEYDPTLKPD